jgi:hypothetical protein
MLLEQFGEAANTLRYGKILQILAPDHSFVKEIWMASISQRSLLPGCASGHALLPTSNLKQ